MLSHVACFAVEHGAAARCIQELVRELSVHCMEQGQLLAFVWSSYVQALRDDCSRRGSQRRNTTGATQVNVGNAASQSVASGLHAALAHCLSRPMATTPLNGVTRTGFYSSIGQPTRRWTASARVVWAATRPRAARQIVQVRQAAVHAAHPPCHAPRLGAACHDHRPARAPRPRRRATGESPLAWFGGGRCNRQARAHRGNHGCVCQANRHA